MAIREISRSGPNSRHADEIRWRSHGHWPHVQGSVAKGDTIAGAEFTLARASGHARIVTARKNRYPAPGPHPLAARCPRARDFREGSRRADEDRPVVYRAIAGNHRDEPEAGLGHGGNSLRRF